VAGNARSGGRNKVSAEEHMRRGTFKRSRHLEPPPSKPGRKVDYTAWLTGLSPAAQACGRRLLQTIVPHERAAFREYLVVLAPIDAMPRYTVADLEALAAANSRAAALNARILWCSR
jgi:hypothetical protein